jgi:nitroreductase
MTTFNKDDVLQVFKNRASTRSYDATRKISDDEFLAILECARLSPSSVGSEPWQFLVIQNPELRKALKPVSWGMANTVETASHVVVILAKKNARWDSPFFDAVIARRGLTDENKVKALAVYQKFQEQDIAVLDSDRTLFDWAGKQTYIALANMMTGAAFLGIDSCPVEGFDYKAVNEILADAELFDPNEWGVSVMVTFGYRNKDIRPKSRKALDEIVQFVK